MGPMAEHEGTFQPAEEKRHRCYKCKQDTVKMETWDSSCGGYTDYKYTCENPACKHVWWVDGIDS